MILAEAEGLCAMTAGFGLQPLWCTNHNCADDWMGNYICYCIKKPYSLAVTPIKNSHWLEERDRARQQSSASACFAVFLKRNAIFFHFVTWLYQGIHSTGFARVLSSYREHFTLETKISFVCFFLFQSNAIIKINLLVSHAAVPLYSLNKIRFFKRMLRFICHPAMTNDL